ncbi:MAG: dihydropteroate synthase [Alphaproteobacteria bacterium]|nr:dihydropteroate synthase [Alphaproteobacteria bacterium]
MTQEIRTRIVAIINLTPDSFSDGGKYAEPESAVSAMENMVEQGADVLDIGAESTRPGARTLSHEEEWERLSPILSLAKSRFPHTAISVDTRNPTTAARAIDCGVDWINDVNGGKDPQMLAVIRSASCKYVVMHSLTVPANPKEVLHDSIDVVTSLRSWAEKRMQDLHDAGIAKERIILDPGIGFGKTAQQSWDILRNIPKLADIDAPMLVGHSRKSFLKLVTEKDAKDRDLEGSMISAWLVRNKISYLRVHDVVATKRAIAVGMQLQERLNA